MKGSLAQFVFVNSVKCGIHGNTAGLEANVASSREVETDVAVGVPRGGPHVMVEVVRNFRRNVAFFYFYGATAAMSESSTTSFK